MTRYCPDPARIAYPLPGVQWRLRRLTRLLPLVALLLVACGSPTRPAPQLLATAPPAAPTAPAPQPAAVRGQDLPGRLLFVQNGTIWLWQGREGRPLLGNGVAWQPAWSPDASRIAYIERGSGYSDMMLAAADGSHLAQLTTYGSRLPLHSRERVYDSMWVFYPAWSPDGATLTISSQYGPPFGVPAIEYNMSLYSLPAQGGSRRQIYADDGAHCGRTVYAPDGGTLAFTRAATTPGGTQQIYRINLARGGSEVFPGAPPASYDPAFSPDGAWLVFAARDGERTDIWMLPGNPATGSAPSPLRLTSLGTARAPAISPDGTLLAFLAVPPGEGGFELWVANLSVGSNNTLRTDNPRQITRNMRLDADSGLSWAP